MDDELVELTENKESNQEIDNLEDWRFLASCLQIGLSISDLKLLKYVDVAKIMITLSDNSKKDERKATQNDINMLLM